MKQKSRSPVLAVRRLRKGSSHKNEVVVKLGCPCQVKAGEWCCSYTISGLGRGLKQSAYGVDSVQALLMALEGICCELKKAKELLTWEGGEIGDTGFPRFVPSFFGVAFAKRLENLLDTQIERRAHALEAKGKRNLKKYGDHPS